jgi:peptidoglycan/LPS O-acetylase OafA/YrhL
LAVHHPRWGEKIVRFASLPLLSPLVLATTVSAIVFAWTKLWVLHALLALLVLACSAQPRHGLSRFLDHPVMAYVGRVSYGIYMWHVAVIGGVKALCPSLVNQPVWLFALSMPLSVVVAAISYQYFEQPLLRLGKGFRRLELVGNGSPMRIRGSQS